MTLSNDAATVPPRMPLRAALDAAADEINREQPPAWLERAALAHLPMGRVAAPAPRRIVWNWTGGLALAGVLGVVLLLRAGPAPQPLQVETAQPSGFLPLVSADMLADASAGPAAAWVVATEMPRDRLAALGLPYDPARAGDNVPAELLMNASGQVLAVRLLRQ
jgi:hypothetical protein